MENFDSGREFPIFKLVNEPSQTVLSNTCQYKVKFEYNFCTEKSHTT